MHEFGIAMDGRTPVANIAALAGAAEEGGAVTLWVAAHLFLRDPITTAAIALHATRRIKVALMAMSPYAVHPVFTAMAAATLEEMFPGRVILCLGVGAPADLQAAGIASARPLTTLAEAILQCGADGRLARATEACEPHGDAARRGHTLPLVRCEPAMRACPPARLRVISAPSNAPPRGRG